MRLILDGWRSVLHFSTTLWDAAQPKKFQNSARLDFGNVTQRPNFVSATKSIARAFTDSQRFVYELNTSRTFRDNACNVKGFCKNAVPGSSTP